MWFFPRASVLFAFGATSVALFACGAGTNASTSQDESSTAAQPLLEACAGTFRCADDGTHHVDFELTLARVAGACTSTGNEVLTDDHQVRADVLGTPSVVGHWWGDSHTLHECSELHCWTCTNEAYPTATPGQGGDQVSRCSGVTSCDGFGAGNCGNHQGCNLHGHAVYSSGMFDHYEDECQGSTPSCSSHTTEAECKAQDCTWK